MKKLLIVDGHNLLFQMFYGMPSHFYGKYNQPIWATFGFVGAMNKIINLTNPTHLLVVFDGETHNPRNELLSEYKSNRIDYKDASDDESPFTQLPDIYRCLEALDIKYYETKVVEADDIIAGYVNKYKDINIVIASNDSDFYQLVNKNVSILRYKGKSSLILNEKDIFAKIGVHPYQYADYKALVGDNTDVIKGVLGVGPITASKLLLDYGNLNNLLANIDLLKNGKIKNNIKSSIDRIRLNYKLIHLDYVDVLPFDIESLEYKNNKFTTKEVLTKLDIM